MRIFFYIFGNIRSPVECLLKKTVFSHSCMQETTYESLTVIFKQFDLEQFY